MGECMLTRRGGAGGGGKDVDHIEVTTPPNTTRYIDGATFDMTGTVISAVYSDGSKTDVTEYVTYEPTGIMYASNAQIESTQTITFSFPTVTKEGTVAALKATYEVTMLRSIKSLTIQDSGSFVQTMTIGDAIHISDVVIKATTATNGSIELKYNAEAQAAAGSDPSSYHEPFEGFIASKPDGTIMEEAGSSYFYFYAYSWKSDIQSYNEYTSYYVTVKNPVVSIEVTTPPQLNYVYSSYFSYSDAVVTATYQDGSTEDITDDVSWSVSGGTYFSAWKDTTVTATCTKDGVKLNETYPIKVRASWKKGTDAEIVTMIAENDAGTINLTDFWAVGDYRSVSLSAITTEPTQVAQSVSFMLMDTACTGFTVADTGKKPTFMVQMTGILKSTGVFGTSSTTSWIDSTIRTWANNSFRNALPSSIVTIFKKFTWSLWTKDSYPYVTASEDYFGLMPEGVAVGQGGIYSSSKEASLYSKWEYFQSNSYAKIDTSTGRYVYYWTGSRYYSSSTVNFIYVNTNKGMTYATPDTYRPLSFFGCI